MILSHRSNRNTTKYKLITNIGLSPKNPLMTELQCHSIELAVPIVAALSAEQLSAAKNPVTLTAGRMSQAIFRIFSLLRLGLTLCNSLPFEEVICAGLDTKRVVSTAFAQFRQATHICAVRAAAGRSSLSHESLIRVAVDASDIAQEVSDLVAFS